MTEENLLGKRVRIRNKEVTLKGQHNTFKFKCTDCDSCCRETKIGLTPYDVYVLAKKLGMTMKEFRKNYTSLVIGNNIRVLLDTKGGCKFLKDGKCTVYSSRPSICRFYPLGVYLERDNAYFYEASSRPCIKSGKKMKIEEYLKENLDENSLDIHKEWLNFGMKLMNSKVPVNDRRFLEAYVNILYNFDDPAVKAKIGELSNNPKEAVLQVLKFAEKVLLKP